MWVLGVHSVSRPSLHMAQASEDPTKQIATVNPNLFEKAIGASRNVMWQVLPPGRDNGGFKLGRRALSKQS